MIHEELASTEEEAEARAKTWRLEDPFPNEIVSALLSRNDIKKYVQATGLLFPFYDTDDRKAPLHQRGRFKAASYEAWPSRFIRWENGKKIIDDVDITEYDKNGFVLKENSITFMQIDTRIRLPYYIALRFNLSITHVHRGLLLGTGPLVDPGFDGELLIPLHNLTSAEYRIRRGVVWFEFTKISSVPTIPADFENRKRKVDIETYFERASGNNPIQSSIPTAVTDAQKSASEAKSEARKAARTNTFFASLGFLAILGMILAAVSFGVSVLRDANKALAETEVLKAQTEVLRRELQELDKKSSNDQIQMRELQGRIDRLQRVPAPNQP